MMTGITHGIAGFLLGLSLGINSPEAAVAPPQGFPEEPILLAASAPAKESSKSSTSATTKAMHEEMKKRGADLDNFIYEVFDPNAKDPLAELGKTEMAGAGHRRKLLWIAAGTAVLAGAGTAGYLWYHSLTSEAKIINLDYHDGI